MWMQPPNNVVMLILVTMMVISKGVGCGYGIGIRQKTTYLTINMCAERQYTCQIPLVIGKEFRGERCLSMYEKQIKAKYISASCKLLSFWHNHSHCSKINEHILDNLEKFITVPFYRMILFTTSVAQVLVKNVMFGNTGITVYHNKQKNELRQIVRWILIYLYDKRLIATAVFYSDIIALRHQFFNFHSSKYVCLYCKLNQLINFIPHMIIMIIFVVNTHVFSTYNSRPTLLRSRALNSKYYILFWSSSGVSVIIECIVIIRENNHVLC